MGDAFHISRWALLKCMASAKARSAMRAVSGYRRPRFALGAETPIQTFYNGPLFDPLGTRAGLEPIAGVPPYGLPAVNEDLRWLESLEEITFEVDPGRSFFGDAINVVHAPGERSLDPDLPPFGWSAPSLTGGLAITCSPPDGRIRLTCARSGADGLDVTLTHGEAGLRGMDGILSTPSGYAVAVRDNLVRDAGPRSRARLDLATGRLLDFHYNVAFSNSAIQLLCTQNPGLVPPPLLFPGLPHAGHTMGWLEYAEDRRQLTLHIIAQQFLPLGSHIEDRPLRMPPTQSTNGPTSPFPAANSSLHPYISIVATAPAPQGVKARRAPHVAAVRATYRCEPKLPTMPSAGSLGDYQNQVVSLTCIPGGTDFGDDFSLRSSALGGSAVARSPLFGKLQVQFGSAVAGKLPFALFLEEPTPSLRSKAARLLTLLPPGTKAGLVGMHGELLFPKQTYLQHELSLTTDPYKVSLGVLDLATGRFEDMILRAYLFQNVMRNLLLVEPRTPTDSFCYVCDGEIRSTAAGLSLSAYGDFTIPYPAGYAFPLPGGGKTRIEAGSYLVPFLNLEAVESGIFRPIMRPFEFRAARHVRGRGGADATLAVRPRGDRMIAELGGAFGDARADVVRMSSATVGAAQIVEFELRVQKAGRAAAEYAYGVLLDRGGQSELLMTSERERFDTWLEGPVEEIATGLLIDSAA